MPKAQTADLLWTHICFCLSAEKICYLKTKNTIKSSAKNGFGDHYVLELQIVLVLKSNTKVQRCKAIAESESAQYKLRSWPKLVRPRTLHMKNCVKMFEKFIAVKTS